MHTPTPAEWEELSWMIANGIIRDADDYRAALLRLILNRTQTRMNP